MRSAVRLATPGGVLAAAPLQAQTVQFYYYPDTTVSVVVGDSSKAQLQISGVPNGGIARYGVTFFYDAARVQLVRADSFPGSSIGAPTRTPFAGDSVKLAWTAPATNTAAGTVSLANVWFRVLNGAVEGSLVSMRLDSLNNTAGAELLPNHRTTVLNLCQANTYWGDVTGEHQITSR